MPAHGDRRVALLALLQLRIRYRALPAYGDLQFHAISG